MAIPEKSYSNHGNVMEFMLQKLQTAKQKLNHVPYIISGEKKMAVWSDIRETLFLGCVNPKCTIVLNALKHKLSYPVSELYMHACSQTEQLQFLRQFMIVAPGTLLVDLNCLKNSETLMKLHDMVSVKHRKSTDANAMKCNNAAKLKDLEFTSCKDEAFDSKSKHKGKLMPVIIRKGSDRQENGLGDGSLEKHNGTSTQKQIVSQQLISRTVYKPKDIGKALIPLTLLKKAFPECSGSLQEVANSYIRRCTEVVSSVTQCLTEEGQMLSTFLAVSKGYGKSWLMLTTCSLMMSWEDFWRCCHSNNTNKHVLMNNVSVCILNVQRKPGAELKENNDTMLIEMQDKDIIQPYDLLESSREAELKVAVMTNNIQKINISGPEGISQHLEATEAHDSAGLNYKIDANTSSDCFKIKSSEVKKNELSTDKNLKTRTKKQSGPKAQKIFVDVRHNKDKIRHTEQNNNAVENQANETIHSDKVLLMQKANMTRAKKKKCSMSNDKKEKDFQGICITRNKVRTHKQQMDMKPKRDYSTSETSTILECQSDSHSSSLNHINSNKPDVTNLLSKVKLKKPSKQRKKGKANSKTDCDTRPVLSDTETKLRSYELGAVNVNVQSLDTVSADKAVMVPVYSTKEAYDEMVSSLAVNSDQQDDRNNNGIINKIEDNHTPEDEVENSNQSGSITNESRSTCFINKIDNIKVVPEKFRDEAFYEAKVEDVGFEKSSVSDSKGRSVNLNRASDQDTFSFKSYLEALYVDIDCTANESMGRGEKTATKQTSKTLETEETSLDQYLNYHPPPVFLPRPKTAKPFDVPRTEFSVNTSRKQKSKSAVTQASQKHSVPENFCLARGKALKRQVHSATSPDSAGIGKLREDQNKIHAERNYLQTGVKKNKNIYVVICGKSMEASPEEMCPGLSVNREKNVNESEERLYYKNANKQTHKVSTDFIDKIIDSETRDKLQRSDKNIPTKSSPVAEKDPIVTVEDTCEENELQKMKIKESQEIKEHETKINTDFFDSLSGIEREEIGCNYNTDKSEASLKFVKQRNEAPSDTRPPEIQTPDMGWISADNDSKDIFTPCFGPTSSRAPDVYDIYARLNRPVKKVMPTVIIPSPQANGSIWDVGVDSRTDADTKKMPFAFKQMTPVDKKGYSVQKDTEKHYKPSQCTGKLLEDLVLLCKEQEESGDGIEEISQSLKHGNSDGCFLCQTNKNSEDQANILNQLAYHLLEKMKNLSVKNIESKMIEADKWEINATGAKIHLLDKVSTFGNGALFQKNNQVSTDKHERHDVTKIENDALDQSKEIDLTVKQTGQYLRNESNADGRDLVSSTSGEAVVKMAIQEHTSISKELSNKTEVNKTQLNPSDLFMPVKGPVFNEVLENGPYIPLFKHSAFPDNLEHYPLETKFDAEKSETQHSPKIMMQNQGGGKLINSSCLVLNPSEEANGYVRNQETNPGEKRQEDTIHSVKEVNMKRSRSENACPMKHLNLNLRFDEDLESSQTFSKNLRSKSARSTFYPFSLRQFLTEETKLETKSRNLSKKVKAAKHRETVRQGSISIHSHDVTMKPIQTAKDGTSSQSLKDNEHNLELMGQCLSHPFSTQTNQASLSPNRKQKHDSLSSKSEIGKRGTNEQSARQSLNRTLKSERITASKECSNQNRIRRNRFEQRPECKSKTDAIETLTSITEKTLHTSPRKEPVTSQVLQKKLQKYIISQIRKKRKIRAIKSAPSRIDKPSVTDSKQVGDEGKDRSSRFVLTGDGNASDGKLSCSDEASYSDVQSGEMKVAVNDFINDSKPLDSNSNNNTNNGTDMRNIQTLENNEPQIDHTHVNENGNTADIDQENTDVEIDVDEVIDWEFPSEDITRTVDEVTYTITHADGTQLIVSNKHPDFKNIVKFIEETKRVCGDDSITIEAELNVNAKQNSPLEDEIITEAEKLKTDQLCLEAIPDMDQDEALFASCKPNVYNSKTESNTDADNPESILVFSGGSDDKQLTLKVSDLEIANESGKALNPLKPRSTNTSTNFRKLRSLESGCDSYSICNTFRNLISEELVTQCFMDEDEVGYRGVSLLTGKEYKHHDNIFEAFDPYTVSAGKKTGLKSLAESVTKSNETERDFLDNLLPDYQETLKGKDDVSRQVNKTVSDKSCNKKSSIIEEQYQKVCLKHTEIRNLPAYISKTEPDTGREEIDEELSNYKVSGDDVKSTDTNLTHSVDESLEAETYEVLQIPEHINCTDVMLVEENVEADFMKSLADRRELHGVEEIPCDPKEFEEMPKLRAEPSMSLPVCTTDILNNDCQDQYIKIRDFLKKESAEMTGNMDEFNHLIGNLNSPFEDNVGRNTVIPEYESDILEPKTNADNKKRECRSSDLEDVLPDQENIFLDYDKCTDVEKNYKISNKLDKTQLRKRCQRKKSANIIQKTVQDLFDSHTNSISNCGKEQNKSERKKRTGSKKGNVKETTHNKRKLRSWKKSVKQMSGDESYDEEEEKRKEREEQIAAEGFVQTQQKYMEIILSKSMEVKREKRIVADTDHISDDRGPSNNFSACSLASLPEGLPIHGERQCHKAKGDDVNSDHDDDDKEIWIDDLFNNIRYQLIDDEDGANLGGLAFYRETILPYIYINGYKFTPLKDALPCFTHCQPGCTIPRSVLNQHQGLVRSLSTWEQVYKLELIMSKKGYNLKTGDMLVKLESLLSLLPELTREIVCRHENTTLKRSKNCDVALYSA